ncbi:MAG: diversity-generating retroelement protein Avd [Phycisphaerae bacterium]|nr:diversity-generating retroelement protein Avd [Phycisphaerae bacterium]
MAKEELLVIDRMYELVKWFLGHLAKFPRSHRYGLGQRIEGRLYAVLEGLIRAKYTAGAAKWQELSAVSLDLEILRLLARLADELAVLPHKSHEHAVREMNEIGKMVGGWLKQQRHPKAPSIG